MKNSIKKLCYSLFPLMLFTLVFVLGCNHGNDTKDNQQKPDNSKQSETVVLKTLKVNGVSFEIKDVIDLKKTNLDKIKIEYTTSPSDAEVTFTPNLTEKSVGEGVWNIGNEAGKKTLTIKVKKGLEQHTYTLSIERLPANALKLTKITCDAEEITENIFSVIGFKEVSKSYVTLKVEPSDATATVEFSGFGESIDAKTWKWLLANGENSLDIKLKKGSEEVEYKAKIRSKMSAVNVGVQLNGIQMYNLPDDFEEKALNGENPTFDAKCNHLLLSLMTVLEMKEVIVFVDGTKEEFPKPESSSGFFKTSEKLYMLTEGEKQFEMFIIPSDSLMGRSSCKHLKFKVKGINDKLRLEPELSINGNAELPKDFLSNLEKPETEAPLYKLFKGPARLSIAVSSYEKLNHIKEVKIDGSVVPFPPKSNIIEHTISVEESTPKKVKVEFIPKNEAITQALTWNFSLQLGGDKPKVFGVKLESINDVGSLDGELPESLTGHLTDDTNPLYEYNGTTATVVLTVEDKDMVQDALFKLDNNAGETVAAITEGRYTYIPYQYQITDLSEHNIEIIVHPKNSAEYEDLTLKFRLKRTGKKIKIPARPFSFQINGLPSNKMPKDVKEHLTDGTAPIYEINGFDVVPNVASFDEPVANMIKHVRFTFEGEAPREVTFQKVQAGFFDSWQANTSFIMAEAKKPYSLKVELIPNDDALYEPLVYTLKMQSSGVAIDMPLAFGVDMKLQKDGAVLKLNAENALVLVQAKSDIMKSVTITIKDVDSSPVDCEVKPLQDAKGVPFWQASRDVNLLDGDATPERTIIIKVEPNDPKKYLPATRTYKITGTKIAKNNAKFVIEKRQPKVYAKVEYKAGAEGQYLDDYGVTSIKFTGVYTESAKATVRYAVISPTGDMIDFPTGTTPTEKYKVMSNNKGVHTTDAITLFTDKPTKLKVWVVAEDGNTTDDTNGLYIINLNPISLKWSYQAKDKANAKFEDFENDAYDEIEIKKSQIQDTDKHIYIAVRVWDDDKGGFKVKDTEGQGAFEKLTQTDDEKDNLKQTYMLKFDVSKLKDGQENELAFKCNMWDKDLTKDCFTYIVKIKAKN